ncbi:MAG: hypothetical protein ACRDOU_17585 [Streptosporangiaceae bacterium]
MAAFGPATSYLIITSVFLLFGTGMGLSITPATAAALSAVRRQRSGIASGTVNATRQAGTTVGIAALGSIIASEAVSGLNHALVSRHVPAPLAQKAAAAAVTAPSSGAAGGTGLSRAALTQLYGQVFTSGINLAAVIAGIVTLLAAALAPTQILSSGNPGRMPGRALSKVMLIRALSACRGSADTTGR